MGKGAAKTELLGEKDNEPLLDSDPVNKTHRSKWKVHTVWPVRHGPCFGSESKQISTSYIWRQGFFTLSFLVGLFVLFSFCRLFVSPVLLAQATETAQVVQVWSTISRKYFIKPQAISNHPFVVFVASALENTRRRVGIENYPELAQN